MASDHVIESQLYNLMKVATLPHPMHTHRHRHRHTNTDTQTHTHTHQTESKFMHIAIWSPSNDVFEREAHEGKLVKDLAP